MSQYLGDISAYALAVSQGYTGTEDEYAELMASYATVGQTAVTAAQTATTKASEAATSATTATNKASEATTAATTATNKAAEAQADADAAALDASQAMSAASTATTKATEATTAAATATSAATTATTAKDDAVSAKTAAQTAQTGAETAAASVQSSAAQIATNTEDIAHLKSELTASQIVSNVDLTNYTQGYIVASTGAISTNSDLGRVDGIVLRKGSKISLTAKGYSTVIAMIYRCNSDGTYTCLVASDSNSVKTYEYTAAENVVVGLSFYVGSSSRNAEVFLAVSDALNAVTPKYNYLTVGTGKQYTDIKSAINAVTNPSASNRYVIYVYEGQYNTYDSNQLSSSYKGLILPDYTDIIGIGNRDNIVLYFRGTTETSAYNNNISTLNVGGHNTVENMTIVGKHCRYAVHDDFLATGETEQTYKNVKFIIEAADTSAMASASSNVPYGCGAEIKKKLDFENCIFENDNNIANFFYHDITAATMIMGAIISFVNCRFIGGRYSIQLTKYNTPKESRIYLYGCKADKGGFIRGDGTTSNTMYISGFASQGFTFTGNGTISQEDIDACIDLI